MPQSGEDAIRFVVIGLIRKPVGLGGWCGVMAYGRTLSGLETPCTVYVGDDENTCEPKQLSSIAQGPKGFRCLFEGHADLVGAETLRGKKIFFEKNLLEPLDDASYYHFELEGMRIVSKEGARLGTVSRVQNYPTVDALDVVKTDGGRVLVPMTKEVILNIDKRSGTITVAAGDLDSLFE